MSLPDMPTSCDWKNVAPQTTLKGRRWTAEVEFYLSADASPEQVEELLNDLLGGECIQPGHPLESADLSEPVTITARSSRGYVVMDWSEQVDGRRTGRPRFIDEGVSQ